MKRAVIKSIFLVVLLSGIQNEIRASETYTQIVVVKTKDLPQYHQSYIGFINTLHKSGITSFERVINLDKSSFSLEKLESEIYYYQPDLIHTIGTEATLEISRRISDIPIIFSMVLNPEAQGIIKNAINISNLYGVALDPPIEDQLSTVHRYFPDIRKIAILWNPKYDSIFISKARKLAKEHSIRLNTEELESEQYIETVVGTLFPSNELLWILPNPYTMSYLSMKRVFKYCNFNDFPVFGISEYHVEDGALLGLRADYEDAGKQAGELAVKIIRNEKISNPHILQPRNFKVFINKTTAQKMGFSIPANFLNQAERIYE
ncbi:hypothetical protein GF337_00960 [candidate division KSB1 bacterium]|nr:hypothetical protein [candidate division KSB1 bacterium]